MDHVANPNLPGGYGPLLPGLGPKRPVDLIRARQEIPWVADDDLEELEPRSKAGAATLSFFTWGGGHLFAYDYWRGAGLIAGLVVTIVLFSSIAFLPTFLFTALYLVGGAAFAFDAYRRARAVTRFVRTRIQLQLSGVANPAHYRLLAAAASVDPHLAGSVPALGPALGGALQAPGPRFEVPHDASPAARFADLLDRLRKLHALRAAGIISDVELRDRKVDILSAVAVDDRAALDRLLFELLPLADEGVLEPADFEFLKGASAGR